MPINSAEQEVNLNGFLTQCGERGLQRFSKSRGTFHSETHSILSVEYPESGAGAIVRLFDRNAPGLSIHFTGPNGAPEKIVVANAGRSGECAYKPSPNVIRKLAAIVSSNPDAAIPGNVISLVAGALGIRNVNVHDSRPGHSTVEWEGAKKGIAEIQEALAEQVGHYFPTPVFITNANPRLSAKPGG